MAIKNIWMIVLLSAVVFIAHVTAEENTKSNLNANSAKNDGCIGCPIDLMADDPEVTLYLDKAFNKYKSQYPGDNYPALHTYLRGYKKLVNGWKYVLTVNVAKSNCPKNKETTENCTVLADSPINLCVVTVFARDWENYEDIDVYCEGLQLTHV